MGIETLYRRPRTTKPEPGHKVYPYLLRGMAKYEEVYLHAYDSVSEARSSIGCYFDFYNRRRPHASLDGFTPDQAYFTLLPLRMAA
jgi:transposase InsO family protein